MSRRKPQVLSNWPVYAIGQTIVVDKVLQYERLSEDLAELVDNGSLPAGVVLPESRLKSAARPLGQDASSLMSQDDRDYIATQCRREIQQFRYSQAIGDGPSDPSG